MKGSLAAPCVQWLMFYSFAQVCVCWCLFVSARCLCYMKSSGKRRAEPSWPAETLRGGEGVEWNARGTGLLL